jgi:hypothetical protein
MAPEGPLHLTAKKPGLVSFCFLAQQDDGSFDVPMGSEELAVVWASPSRPRGRYRTRQTA